MYTFEQLKADVKTEADNLKVHATKEELGKLNAELLNPRNYSQCVYGMMTKSCFSTRASFLIFNCCPRYFKAELENESSIETASKFGFGVTQFVNGEKIEGVENDTQLHKIRDHETTLHYSAIEAYIMLPEAKNAELISYLRGETETLEL